MFTNSILNAPTLCIVIIADDSDNIIEHEDNNSISDLSWLFNNKDYISQAIAEMSTKDLSFHFSITIGEKERYTFWRRKYNHPMLKFKQKKRKTRISPRIVLSHSYAYRAKLFQTSNGSSSQIKKTQLSGNVS